MPRLVQGYYRAGAAAVAVMPDAEFRAHPTNGTDPYYLFFAEPLLLPDTPSLFISPLAHSMMMISPVVQIVLLLFNQLAESLPMSEFLEGAGYDNADDERGNSNKDGRAYNAPVAYAGLILRQLQTA